MEKSKIKFVLVFINHFTSALLDYPTCNNFNFLLHSGITINGYNKLYNQPLVQIQHGTVWLGYKPFQQPCTSHPVVANLGQNPTFLTRLSLAICLKLNGGKSSSLSFSSTVLQRLNFPTFIYFNFPLFCTIGLPEKIQKSRHSHPLF